MINDAEEKVRIIRANLKGAQSRQKSYYDKHHKEIHYEIGGKVYLRVSPLRGVKRFGIKGSLLLAMLVLSPYWLSEEIYLISWSFPPTF